MKNYSIILLLAMLVTLGCSSSHIVSSWKAESIPAKRYNKILVLSLHAEREIELQERMEAHLVGDLRELTYEAVSAHEKYGPPAFRNMDEKTALDKLQEGNYDAVITIVLLNKERERYYVPGYTHYSPYAIYYNNFWRYHTTMYQRIYEPGYYTNVTRYFWECNFYDLSTRQLLYSSHSESFNPGSAETLAHEYGKMMLKDMVKTKVLEKSIVARDKSLDKF
jgi:hypothetical protein